MVLPWSRATIEMSRMLTMPSSFRSAASFMFEPLGSAEKALATKDMSIMLTVTSRFRSVGRKLGTSTVVFAYPMLRTESIVLISTVQFSQIHLSIPVTWDFPLNPAPNLPPFA